MLYLRDVCSLDLINYHRLNSFQTFCLSDTHINSQTLGEREGVKIYKTFNSLFFTT